MQIVLQLMLIFLIFCGSFGLGYIIIGAIDRVILCPLSKIKPKKKKKRKNCKKIGDVTLENWLDKIALIQGELA